MIVNQKTQYHWQLIVVTKKAPIEILKNGMLFLFLHSQFPSVAPNAQIKIDFAQLTGKDIFGTCLMQKTNAMVASLKQQCLVNFTEDSSNEWSLILSQSQFTSAAYFMSYAKNYLSSTQNRIVIEAFISKRRSKEYDSEVQKATKQESMLERNKCIRCWISIQSD